MLKNCVFKDSVNTMKADGQCWHFELLKQWRRRRASAAVMGTSTVLSAIDWRMVLSSAIVAGIVSILTSVVGLPEAPCEGE